MALISFVYSLETKTLILSRFFFTYCIRLSNYNHLVIFGRGYQNSLMIIFDRFAIFSCGFFLHPEKFIKFHVVTGQLKRSKYSSHWPYSVHLVCNFSCVLKLHGMGLKKNSRSDQHLSTMLWGMKSYLSMEPEYWTFVLMKYDFSLCFQNGFGCGSCFIGRCCSNYFSIYRIDWCFLLFDSWTFSAGKYTY